MSSSIPAGDPVLLDWESAEPDGLPGMDLVYFLAQLRFVLDHSIENGRTRESLRSPARSGDPLWPHPPSRPSTICKRGLNIHPADFARIRLLCWVRQSRSELPPPPARVAWRAAAAAALREAMFRWPVEEEPEAGIRRAEVGSVRT